MDETISNKRNAITGGKIYNAITATPTGTVDATNQDIFKITTTKINATTILIGKKPSGTTNITGKDDKKIQRLLIFPHIF